MSKVMCGASLALITRRKFGSNHDVILLYSKTQDFVFHSQFGHQHEEYMGRFRLDDNDGRGLYRLAPLDSPNPRPNLTYEYKGYKPPAKGWRVSRDLMEQLDADGRLYFPKTVEGRIARKHYVQEQEGPKIGDTWTDIATLQAVGKERLGYPTQKPIALLERTISASSNPGDVVLDPFCLTGDTLITARHGLRPIREVQEGDEVLTHEGRYRRVIRCYRRPYQGQMLTLFRSKSNVGIEITPNHPVLAVRAAACPHENRRCLPRSCRYHTSGKHLDCINPKLDYKLEWIEAANNFG